MPGATFNLASSGVVFLQGEECGVERFLSSLLSTSVQSRWIVVYPTQFKSTVSQPRWQAVSSESLLVFGKRHTCWTTKIPVWQGQGQWAGQLGFIQTSGTGAQIFTTGHREMECIQRLLHFGLGFECTTTEDEYVLGCLVALSSSDLFLHGVEVLSYYWGSRAGSHRCFCSPIGWQNGS
eukprot:877272-Rhodomonas_salina.6